MAENYMFTIVNNGYDINEVDKYLDDVNALKKKLEEQAEINVRLQKEREELYKNCVAFAKKIKSLEKQLEEHKNTAVMLPEAPDDSYNDMFNEVLKALNELPSDANNFDELFSLLTGIENETSSYVFSFKNSVENVIASVKERAETLLDYAREEKEKIISEAKNEAEELINENKLAKIKLKTAYNQLGELLSDLKVNQDDN